MIYKYLVIDPVHNRLLCDVKSVGLGELVEIHAPDDETPRSACGKTLRKAKDPNIFTVHVAYDGTTGHSYVLGEQCVLRVVSRNLSGSRRRKCAADEKKIVNMEKNERFKERKVVRAKTGSVRKRSRD